VIGLHELRSAPVCSPRVSLGVYVRVRSVVLVLVLVLAMAGLVMVLACASDWGCLRSSLGLKASFSHTMGLVDSYSLCSGSV
jgi:hypothetical protein